MAIGWDIASIISIASGIIGGIVSWGIMREKLKRLEEEAEKYDERFVSMNVYNAVIPQMQQSIVEIQKDIKKILQILNKTSRKED